MTKKEMKNSNRMLDFLSKPVVAQFITGFSDAEGCFYIRIAKKNRASQKIG